MENHNYLVTIVTIVLNGKSHIEQTIRSVLNQNYAPIEYIIIDGGSTDGTLSLIEAFTDKIDYFISEPDSGIYDAINKGISLANGSLIGIIHCGDYYETNAVSEAVAGFIKSGADIIYGDISYIEEHHGLTINLIKKSDHHNLKTNMSIFHPATFVHRTCYFQYGLYDLSFRIASDYDYFLKLFLRGVKFYRVDKVLANFRDGGASGNYKLSLQENIAIRNKYLGYIASLEYALLAHIKHYFFRNRKWIIEKVIGPVAYFKLKRWYHKKND